MVNLVEELNMEVVRVKQTCVAASVAHVSGNETPFIGSMVVVLHRGQVARAVVSSNHIQ